MLVEVKDARVALIGIERRPPEDLEVRNQPCVRWLAQFQPLFFRDTLIDACPDNTRFSVYAIQPRSLALRNPPARQPNEPFNRHF